MADADLVFGADSSEVIKAVRDLSRLTTAAEKTAKSVDGFDASFRSSSTSVMAMASAATSAVTSNKQLATSSTALIAAANGVGLSAQEAAFALAQQRAAALGAAGAMRGAAGSMAVMGRSYGSATGLIQNAAYQVGDFFVQVASGQNVMMAASQQLPQLLGAFGHIGAILGAVAAIGGAAWMVFSAGETEARSLEDAMSDLTDSVQGFGEAVKAAQGGNLSEQFGDAAGYAKSTYELMARMERINFIRATQEAITQTTSQFAGMTEQLQTWDLYTKNIAANEDRRRVEMQIIKGLSDDILDTYGLTVTQATRVKTAMDEVNNATSDLAKAEAMERLGEALVRAAEEGAKIPPEMLKTGQNAIWAAQRILQMIGAMKTAAGAAATAMVDERQQNIQANRASVQEARELRINKIIEDRVAAYDKLKNPKTGGRGGGGEAAQAEKQFQSLRELMEKETLFQFAEYEKRAAQLKNALDKERITKEQYAEMDAQLKSYYFSTEFEKRQLEYDMSLEQLKLALENEYLTRQQYEAKNAELRWNYTNQALDLNSTRLGAELNGLGNYFQQANQLSGGGYAGLLKAQQSFAAASAFVSAYSGAAQALADPTLTTWQKIAAAGKVLTTGLGFVNAIKSGGGGGSGTTSRAVGAAQAQEPQKTTMVRIEGDTIFSGMMESIVESLWSRSKDGELIIYQGGR